MEGWELVAHRKAHTAPDEASSLDTRVNWPPTVLLRTFELHEQRGTALMPTLFPLDSRRRLTACSQRAVKSKIEEVLFACKVVEYFLSYVRRFPSPGRRW